MAIIVAGRNGEESRRAAGVNPLFLMLNRATLRAKKQGTYVPRSPKRIPKVFDVASLCNGFRCVDYPHVDAIMKTVLKSSFRAHDSSGASGT